MTENEISKLVVDLCFRIHKQYGPGLFESVYEEIFCYEWAKTGMFQKTTSCSIDSRGNKNGSGI
jgi:GxxExxY protein